LVAVIAFVVAAFVTGQTVLPRDPARPPAFDAAVDGFDRGHRLLQEESPNHSADSLCHGRKRHETRDADLKHADQAQHGLAD
jgi:hypothetical protein